MKKIPIRSIKSADAKPEFSDSFTIRTVSELLSGQDMVQDLHRHDFYFILALKAGAGKHEIDFVPHSISANSIFMMRPGQVHRLSLKAHSEGYLMEFGKGFFHSSGCNDFLRKIANQNVCQLDPMGSNKMQSILFLIHEEHKEKKANFQDVIKANLSILFIELIRQRQHTESRLGMRNNYAQERLQDFVDLIENEISAHKEVSYYTDKLSLSTFQLNSITKGLMSKTAAELINDHILLEAKRYLLATSNQVSQVAYHLGYEDVSYFIRFFKKHTGYTPEMFRQNFR